MLLHFFTIVALTASAATTYSTEQKTEFGFQSKSTDCIFLAHIDDPHDEIHPGGLPTKKETEPQRAERERKDNYPFGNHWPPGAEDPDRYKDKKDSKGDGDISSVAPIPMNSILAKNL